MGRDAYRDSIPEILRCALDDSGWLCNSLANPPRHCPWVLAGFAISFIDFDVRVGEAFQERAYSSFKVHDGGTIVVAHTRPESAQTLHIHDASIFELNQAGAVEWQRTLGGDGDDFLYAGVELRDGSYVFVGTTVSGRGSEGDADAWLVKLSDIGAVHWEKTYGGAGADDFEAVVVLNAGDMIVGGDKGAEDVDGAATPWVLRLDDAGDVVWEQTIAGEGSAGLSNLRLNRQSEIVVNGARSRSRSHRYEGWVASLDLSGRLLWETNLMTAPPIRPCGNRPWVICRRRID